MKNKLFTLKVEVPIAIETTRSVNGEKVTTIPQRFDVKGMMHFIRRSMSNKNQQDLLDEYAKFWLYDKLGIEVYPLEK